VNPVYIPGFTVVAGNEAITFLNKNKKRNEVDIEQTTANYRSAADTIDGDEMTLKLERAIATLPDKQKQVFIMRYYDELPYEKMAEISETSVGALKASYHHAVKKIEELLIA
jgi:RNA polymerase sigma-70 factor (ECF subfamily)